VVPAPENTRIGMRVEGDGADEMAVEERDSRSVRAVARLALIAVGVPVGGVGCIVFAVVGLVP
jgi:hypothetical protein